MIEKDATTIWELWNGDTANPAMNSGNHVMLVGDLAVWLYQDLAGIKSEDGFKTIEMSPKPVGDLKYVNAEYNSIRGLIKSNWKKDKNSFTWEITIPVGSTALITLPTGYNIGKINKMSVAGKLETISTENRIKLGSGSYKIISQGKMP